MDLPRVTSVTSLAIGIAQGLERLFPQCPHQGVAVFSRHCKPRRQAHFLGRNWPSGWNGGRLKTAKPPLLGFFALKGGVALFMVAHA